MGKDKGKYFPDGKRSICKGPEMGGVLGMKMREVLTCEVGRVAGGAMVKGVDLDLEKMGTAVEW